MDTILKAFDHNPTSHEIEETLIEMGKYFNTKGTCYTIYNPDIKAWLLRIKTD